LEEAVKEVNGDGLAEWETQLEELSKAELIELVRLYSRLFLAVDGFWYLAVKEIIDEDTATACDFWVWDRYTPYEIKRLMQFRKLEGTDLAAFATSFRLSPWFSNLTYRLTQEGEKMLTLTVLECPTLQALQREGAGRENTICWQVDPEIFQKYIQFFNPKGKANPIELPPRTSGSGICCRWQFVIEE